jgi:hypothetical protein
VRAVSAAFLRTIKSSHSMVARARVCSTFQTGTDPTGTEIPIVDGDVRMDGTAQIRATLDLTTDGNRMWPTHSDSLLAPYGNEVYVERGVRYSDESVEYVGLGYFRIQAPEQEQAPNGPIRITGRDRMAGIVDARLVDPQQFLSGASLGFIMGTLVTQVYPAATIEWDDNTDDDVITRTVIVEEDRFGFLDDLVRSRGKIWHWDHRGVLVIRSLPDPAEPVFQVHSGTGGVLLRLSRQLTRDGVYNAVVATGSGADTLAPAHAVVIDNNPLSPTYFYGRFGPVPRFYSSPFLFSDTQAADAAAAILQQSIGLPYTIDLSAVPNPALEPYDPVSIRPGTGQGRETHVLQTLTIPLVAGEAMTGTTQEQSVVLVGSL